MATFLCTVWDSVPPCYITGSMAPAVVLRDARNAESSIKKKSLGLESVGEIM